MKPSMLARIAILFLFATGCALLSGPGSVRNSVALGWNPYDWEGVTSSCGFILYEQVGTNWVPVASADRIATMITLTNVVPGVHVYALTASNYWGESDLSNTASTPKVTGKPANLRLGQ